jgi:hypothetical protein
MPTRPPPTATIGDIVGTVLLGMVGVAFLVLTVLSVPRWWTTKFEFPPPMLVTIGLAGIACMALYITRLRLPLFPRYSERFYVGTHHGDVVTVYEGNVAHRSILRRLGAKRVTLHCWDFPTPDEQALARVLTALRDAGAVFPGDDYKGFTVSDEFMALRERGLVSGSFCQLGDMGELRER